MNTMAISKPTPTDFSSWENISEKLERVEYTRKKEVKRRKEIKHKEWICKRVENDPN